MSNQSVVTPNSPGVQSPPNNGIGTPGTPGGMTGSSNNNNTSTTNNNNNSNNSGNSSFLDILNSWKQFNVENKKVELESFISQIATLKDDCVQSRKVLAKQTQDFKKVADDEKLKTFGALLKLYQEEVDKLTKRSKFSETCFFTLYKDLSDTVDPVPALTAALDEYAKVDSTAKLEIENKKLQLELADFRKEFQEIQNQEVTIRRLEDKVKEYESRMESSTNERIASREQELKQDYKAKIHVLKDRNQELNRQISQLQEDLNKITRTHDQNQSQIFDLKVKHDDELSSKQSEVDMLTSEIDRISTKLSTLQAENSSIREESLKEKNSIQPLVKRIAELELELLQKDSEISKLNDQLIELKQSLKDEKSTLKEVLTQLDIEREKIEKMEKHIQNNPSPADYENVKRELATLQAIVGSDEVTNSNQQNVDKLMKEKNRQLENELTKLRLTAGTYETELDESRRRVQQLESIQIEQSQLIHRLEEDITTRGGSSMLNNGGLIGNSGNVNANQPQDLESLISQSTTPSLNQSLNNLPDSTSSQSTIVVQSKDDKMLDIVVGQRDRFKVKNLELEGEKSQLEKQLETCKLETSSLKQDNIKLYEKIRFLQSYDKNRGGGIITGNPKRAENSYDLERAGGGSSGSGGGSGGGRSNNTGGETEEKYGKLYEDSINPFLSFNKKEKYRRYKEMNTAERVILNTSRFFLSNKYSRLFLFIYSILLHLLVFITLYKLAVTTAEQHADDYVPGANNQFNIDTLINNQTKSGSE